MATDTDQASKFGLMAPSTRVNGNLTKPMAKVNFGMRTVMSMRVIGKRTKQVVTAFMFILMVLNMKVFGKMIFKTVRVLNLGERFTQYQLTILLPIQI
jgi:hypothetical protein